MSDAALASCSKGLTILLVLFPIAIGLSFGMMGAWAVQRVTRRSGWIDMIWSFAVGIGSVTATVFANGDEARRVAACLIVVFWSVRLGVHIGARTRQGAEDPRYGALIEDWGAAATVRMFVFLQAQALAALVLVTAVYLAAANPTSFPHPLDIAAVGIAIVALVGEAVADAQMGRFRRTPAAKTDVCETGLWRYSRHPNYFFEWLGWCAWPLFALSAGKLWSFLSLLAPALMYWLLVHVSGIPPLEEHMLKSRGETFRALQGRVNAFFPGPRKKRRPT
jgi:steroid 5-alpha reductase family enzyme